MSFIIPREEWRARPYIDIDYLKIPVTNIFLGNTNTEPCPSVVKSMAAMRSLQNRHLFKQMRDIRYNFVISNEGIVFEGRGWLLQPSIHKAYNIFQRSSLFVAFLWKPCDEDPPDIMYETLDKLIKLGIKNDLIKEKILLHHLRN